MGISKRIYAEADAIGFSSVMATYGPKSDNFKTFWEHYNPALNNVEDALFRTPAGRLARARGLVPVVDHLGDDIIRVRWIRR